MSYIACCRTLLVPRSNFTRPVVSPWFAYNVPLTEKFVQRKLTTTTSSSSPVYEGPITRMVKGVKIFSLSTSFLGLMSQPLLISKTIETNSLLIAGVGSFVALYSICTPLILHWIARRYVVELHFDSNTKSFTSITLNFINKRKELKFTADDVSVPDTESPMTTFIVRGKPLLVDPTRFTDMSVYGHLMGYDKPLDLRLESKLK